MRSAAMSNDGGDTQRAGKGQSHLPVFHFFSSLNGKFLLNSTNARIAMYKGTSLVDLMCQTAGDLVMSTKTIRRENDLSLIFTVRSRTAIGSSPKCFGQQEIRMDSL